MLTVTSNYFLLSDTLESQRLRSTIHEIIASRVKLHASQNSSRSKEGQATKASTDNSNMYDSRGFLEGFQILKQKSKNTSSFSGAQFVVSPVPPDMTPKGVAQSAVTEFLISILDYVLRILGESPTLYSCAIWEGVI